MLIELSEEKEMHLRDIEFLGQGPLPLHHHLRQVCSKEGFEFSDHPCLYSEYIFA